MSKHLSDFQKSFLARGTGETLFTQKEFDEGLAIEEAKIMTIAIETTKTAISIEREECAKILDEMIKGLEGVDAMPLVVGVALDQAAQKIRNRMKAT